MRDLLTRETPTPAIIREGKLGAMDSNIYDHSERYDDTKEILEEGKYWMGSKTANTRCNKFTLIGADKTHSDETKEKKK